MTSVLSADESSFPPAPPSDLDGAEAIIANDWAAFEHLERMHDHWDRDRWTERYRAYYWMLTFPDAPHLVKLARQCQEALAPLGMDNVPDDGLHITMTKIGEAADIDRDAVERLASATLGTLPPPFVIHAHPLVASRGAARFTVTPWTPLVRLHQAITTANTAARLPGGRPTSRFRPHLGIAYNNRERSAAELAPLLAPLRSLPSVALRVASIDVVELRREDTAYRWDVIRTVPLSSSGK
ncbi:2'-5' RNA ligase family protein [Actinocorallia longicatena]|uniref:2'-5' RNA ligase n=1 Tax=Actinocorallia longicatena TaxID=111803 RepID=A0ABP6QLB3_9ACTN